MSRRNISDFSSLENPFSFERRTPHTDVYVVVEESKEESPGGLQASNYHAKIIGQPSSLVIETVPLLDDQEWEDFDITVEDERSTIEIEELVL